MATGNYPRHAAAEALVASIPAELFAYLDKHSQLSMHMTKRSWMMGGGRMDMTTDEGGFQRLGSRLRLSGKAFGLRIFLEEAVMEYQPPLMKVWETIGIPKLLVIGDYRMGFDIRGAPAGSQLRVFIDYDLPRSPIARLLGYLLGAFYARWCVQSMAHDAQAHFVNSALRANSA